MGQDWIIDVLADLRNFARKNDLPQLTAQLEEAARIAKAEISSAADRPSLLTRGDGLDGSNASSDPAPGRRA